MLMLSLLSLVLNLAPAHADFTDDAIYRGSLVPANSDAWRHTVFLSYGRGSCSGVLIEHDVILTAAHCRIQNGENLYVTFYTENDSDKATTLSVPGDEFAYRGHPGYSKPSIYDHGVNDIAVVVLKLKDKTIPDGHYAAGFQTTSQTRLADPGRNVYPVGMGEIGNGELGSSLRLATGRITGYINGGIMSVRMQAGSGICSGDSGGPVFVKDQGMLFISGLTTGSSHSVAKNCGPNLFVNVITAQRYQWIQRTITNLRK